MVGQVPHRIQRLPGGTGGNGHTQAQVILFPGDFHGNAVQQHLRLRQLAAAHILAGQQPHGGLDDAEAVVRQRFQIVLGDGIFQHGGVHGRGHQLFAPGGQNGGGEHIVRLTVGQLRNHIGGGGGNEDQIRRLGQGNVGHVVLKVPVEGVHNAPVVGQGFKGQRGNKFRGVFRHDHMDVCPGLAKTTCHICHFVGGNSPGDAKNHCFSR